jgi:hypothetical protein
MPVEALRKKYTLKLHTLLFKNNQTLFQTTYDFDGSFRMTGLLISDLCSGQRGYNKINKNSFIISRIQRSRREDYEEFCHLGRNNHESRWQTELLLGLFFDPEAGGDMYLQNDG